MQENQALVDKAIQSSRKELSASAKHRDIRTAILELKPVLAQALPKHLTPDRMIQMATNYVRQNPNIAKCTEQSLLGAIMQASILGLEPVAALGQVYFVPYKSNKGTRENPNWVDEVQFQLGYRGMLQLIHNSNCVKMIYAKCVYEGDTFEHEEGLHPKLKHIPASDRKPNARLTDVYAVAHTKSGGIFFEVLKKYEIEDLRRRNRSQKDAPSGAWQTDYAEMAKAKAIKKLAKYLPLSVEAQDAFSVNEAVITQDAFTNNNGGIDIDAVHHIDEKEWIAEFEKELDA